MTTTHIVRQGDYLGKIAHDHGAEDWKTIWNAPENAELRKLRKDPNILLPGDRVVVPDTRGRTESAATEQRHRFAVQRRTLKLAVILEEVYFGPVADTQTDIEIGPTKKSVVTDQRGKLEEVFPSGQGEARLVVRDSDSRFEDAVLLLEVGHLDPVDKVSGQSSRLVNLGYLLVAISDSTAPAFLSAVEEFQCDQGLQVDGVCGPKTQAKLRELHGC
jgi:N-acetylmuramoyl-L-alanine amidase